MIYGLEEVFIKPNQPNVVGKNFLCLCGRNKYNEIYIVKKIKEVTK